MKIVTARLGNYRCRGATSIAVLGWSVQRQDRNSFTASTGVRRAYPPFTLSTLTGAIEQITVSIPAAAH